MSGPDVVLVSMPWASIRKPALGLGTLSAILKSCGIRSEVRYPSLDFSKVVGSEAYETLANAPSFFGVCEHLFALSLFGNDALDSHQLLRRYDLPDGTNPFERILEHVDGFVRRTADELLESSAPIVGFGCTFNQTLPSLAVARHLKQRRPDIRILLGGSSVHGRMGEAIASAFPHWIDHVFLGEADTTFIPAVKALLAGVEPSLVSGITVGGRETAPSIPTSDLDALPVPDHSDFMRQLEAGGFSADFVEAIPYESSRGCWWGQKSHCTFCGLNSEGIAYRRKSDERILSEIVELSSTYKDLRLMAADNILPSSAWKKLLPKIADLNLDLDLFYEIKANITRSQIQELARAGVRWVQPGIESFSTPVLQLMRKGTTALQNVKTIRLCQEFSIVPSYNILVGFPGEQSDHYLRMNDLLRRITHLPPPSGSASLVQIHRFSPFHDAKESFGFSGVKAASYYRHLVPTSILDPEDYAYFFERDVPDELQFNVKIANEVVKDWLASTRRIAARLGPGFIEIVDTNSGRSLLEGAHCLALSHADEVRPRARLVELLSEVECGEDQAEFVVEEMIRHGWLVADGDSVVGAVPFAKPQSVDGLASWMRSWFPGASSWVQETASKELAEAKR